ncbi:MAG: LysR family transcriptional regulator [Coriobacteriales bacterium]|jgi:DNA-binding transcriptional LysR family regulator
MQINSLRYLIELERYGSISKAARSSFISQQGLSKVIDSLESELGVKVVTRTHSGIEFTEEGTIVLDSAKAIVREYDRMIGRIDNSMANSGGREFNLVLSPYVSITLYDSVIGKIRRSSITSIIETGKEEILGIVDGSTGNGPSDDELYLFDLMGSSGKHGNRDGMVTGDLLKSRIGVMCGSGNPWAKLDEIAPYQVQEIPLVLFNESDYFQAVEEAVGDNGEPNIVMSNSNQRAIESYILREPQACVILDEISFIHRPTKLQDFKFVPLKNAPALYVAFGYRADSSHSRQFEHFIEDFRSMCRATFSSSITMA